MLLHIDQIVGLNAGAAVATCPDGASFFTASGAVAVRRAADTGETLSQLRSGLHCAPVTTLRLSRSGRLLATAQRPPSRGSGAAGGAGGADVCVWDLSAGVGGERLLHRFEAHDGGVAALDISDDDRLLLSVGAAPDGALVMVHDLAGDGGVVAGAKAGPGPTLAARFAGRVRDAKGRPTSLTAFLTAGKAGATAVWALNPVTGALGREVVKTPATLSRDILCAEVVDTPAGALAYLGSTSGDMAVVDVSGRVIRATVAVSGGAVTALAATPHAHAHAHAHAVMIAVGTSDGGVVVVRHTTPAAAAAAAAPSVRPLVVQRLLRLGEGVVWSLAPLRGGDGSGEGWLAATSGGGLFELRPTPQPVSDTASIDVRRGGVDSSGLVAVRTVLRGAGLPGVSPSFAPNRSPLAVAAPGLPGFPTPLLDAATLGSIDALAVPDGESERFATASSDGVVRVWELSGSGGGAVVVDTIVATAAAGGLRTCRPTCLIFEGALDLVISGWTDGAIRAHAAARGGGGAAAAPVKPATPSATTAAATTTSRAGGSGSSSRARPQRGGGDALQWIVPNAHPIPLPSSTAAGAATAATPAPSLATDPAAGGATGVTALVLTRGGRLLVSGGANGTVRVWDVRSREMVASFAEHSAPVTGLCVTPDDRLVLCASRDRSLVTLDLHALRRVGRQGQKLVALEGCELVGGLPGSAVVAATPGSSGRIALWDALPPAAESNGGGAPLRVLGPGHAPAGATCVAAAHGGLGILASGGGDGTVRLWDVVTGAPLGDVVAHPGASVRALRWCGDNRQLISAGDDGVVVVINVYEG